MKAIVTAIVAAVFVFWIVWAVQIGLSESFGWTWKAETVAAWGESFGAFSALFGALGFGAVILTLIMQQQQIEQNYYNQYLQQFDKTFYQLLNLFREAREQVVFRHTIPFVRKFRVSRERRRGVSAFRSAWMEINDQIEDLTSREDAAILYEQLVHRRYESVLGPYFRIFYTILAKLRDEKVLRDADSLQYARLFRSQISSFELVIAGFNGLAEFSRDFDRLLIMFRILKYLPGRRRMIMMRFYPAETFQGRRDLVAGPRPFFRRFSN